MSNNYGVGNGGGIAIDNAGSNVEGGGNGRRR